MNTSNAEVLTVSRLNRDARQLLDRHFGLVWVEAELSNFARPASGHWYFTLKDEGAQVRCAMFRQKNAGVAFRPADGLKVLVRARVSLFEPRGDFQLVVEFMEPAGEGLLRLKFEQLRQKLAAEGLFDVGRKRPLPAWPAQLGVVTSPTGAAVRDVLAVLARRCPSLPIVIYPTAVQGNAAAVDIAAAIACANRRRECDVLIVTRGGGSLEDLWSFNEEIVARAIAASEIPVVSAVGHEVDVTISDFVADVRAPTPSAAAEIVAPDQRAISAALDSHHRRLLRALRGQLERYAERLDWCAQRLPDPLRMLAGFSQRLTMAHNRLPDVMTAKLRQDTLRLTRLSARLQRFHPEAQINRLTERQRQLALRLRQAWLMLLRDKRSQLTGHARALETISPLATLSRGYSIVSNAGNGEIARDSRECPPGTQVRAQLAHGALVCVVERCEPTEPLRASE